MSYFLAITLEADVLNGSFWPSYVLCKGYVTSASRSGLRVVKQLSGKPSSNTPKLLVTETYGHDELVNFMSSYQTQDRRNGKHYHPHGYLCWYQCNDYGEPTGTVQLIKKVPEYVWIFDFANKGYQRMKKDMAKKKTIQEVLTAEPRMTLLDTKKPRLVQEMQERKRKKKKKVKKNACKENRR